MAIVLFNPTEDELRAQYGGIDVKVPADGKLRVDDQKARHILNILGPRGLTSLDYGDEGDIEIQKAEDGRNRSIEFKKRQIRSYNRDNEGRKMRNLEYVEPPEMIRQMAKDLGIVLIQPYDLPDVNTEEISTLRKENKELMAQLKSQSEQFAEAMAMLNQKGLLAPVEDPNQEYIEIFEDMKRTEFESWVESLTFDVFSQYPHEVQKMIMTKWEGFYDPEEKPFPY